MFGRENPRKIDLEAIVELICRRKLRFGAPGQFSREVHLSRHHERSMFHDYVSDPFMFKGNPCF